MPKNMGQILIYSSSKVCLKSEVVEVMVMETVTYITKSRLLNPPGLQGEGAERGLRTVWNVDHVEV